MINQDHTPTRTSKMADVTLEELRRHGKNWRDFAPSSIINNLVTAQYLDSNASFVKASEKGELLTLAFNATDLTLPQHIDGATYEFKSDTYHLELYTDEMHLVNTASAKLEELSDYEEDHDSVVASWQA